MRSIAVRPRIFSRLRCWAGERLCFEDHGVRVERETDLAQFLHLARAEERRGVGCVAALHDARDDVGAGRVDEQRQFVELVVEFVFGDARKLHADQHDLLAKRAIDEGIGYIGHASSHSTFATNCTGPLSVAAAPFNVDVQRAAGIVDGDVGAAHPVTMRDRRHGARSRCRRRASSRPRARSP